jgi:hypothetical protein
LLSFPERTLLYGVSEFPWQCSSWSKTVLQLGPNRTGGVSAPTARTALARRGCSSERPFPMFKLTILLPC